MPKHLWDEVKEVVRRKFIVKKKYIIKKVCFVLRKSKIRPSETSKLVINNIM